MMTRINFTFSQLQWGTLYNNTRYKDLLDITTDFLDIFLICSVRVLISSEFTALDIRSTAWAESFGRQHGRPANFWPLPNFSQPFPTEMSEQPTVQTVSDDEPSEDDEDLDVEDEDSKKQKATGAAAHRCLKRVA